MALTDSERVRSLMKKASGEVELKTDAASVFGIGFSAVNNAALIACVFAQFGLAAGLVFGCLDLLAHLAFILCLDSAMRSRAILGSATKLGCMPIPLELLPEVTGTLERVATSESRSRFAALASLIDLAMKYGGVAEQAARRVCDAACDPAPPLRLRMGRMLLRLGEVDAAKFHLVLAMRGSGQVATDAVLSLLGVMSREELSLLVAGSDGSPARHRRLRRLVDACA